MNSPDQLLPKLTPVEGKLLDLLARWGDLVAQAKDTLAAAEIGCWCFAAACVSIAVYNLFLRSR